MTSQLIGLSEDLLEGITIREIQHNRSARHEGPVITQPLRFITFYLHLPISETIGIQLQNSAPPQDTS